MEDIYTIDQIRDEIIKFKNDSDFQKLESFYYSKSFSEILEISRRENSHSGFIAWLLNNTESHNLGDFSIRKFLDIILKFSHDKLKKNTDIYNSFLTESYDIERVHVEREKAINKVGRLDIYVELTLLIADKQRNVKLIIENKVESKETNDQTNTYFNHFNSILKVNEIVFYVYLTPISTLKLIELEGPECNCKEFIQINYQSIVDYLIEPALNQNISSRTKNIITEYLKSLSQPSIDDEIDGHKQELIMALGNEERKLLTSFWTKNQKLILAALYAISSDPEQEEYTRNTVQDAISGLSSTGKDYTKYVFNRQTYAKNRLVLAVIQDYVVKNPTTTYSQLQAIFPNTLQGQETFTTEAIARQKPSRRNFLERSELIRLTDETIAVSTQWGRVNIELFLGHCIKMGIDIMIAQ
jgi:hypothetical protein